MVSNKDRPAVVKSVLQQRKLKTLLYAPETSLGPELEKAWQNDSKGLPELGVYEGDIFPANGKEGGDKARGFVDIRQAVLDGKVRTGKQTLQVFDTFAYARVKVRLTGLVGCRPCAFPAAAN